MEHVDCLFGRRVVSVFQSKSFNDSSRLDLSWVDFVKPCDCSGLFSCKQTLP